VYISYTNLTCFSTDMSSEEYIVLLVIVFISDRILRPRAYIPASYPKSSGFIFRPVSRLSAEGFHEFPM
jgi:hypothetical protein